MGRHREKETKKEALRDIHVRSEWVEAAHVRRLSLSATPPTTQSPEKTKKGEGKSYRQASYHGKEGSRVKLFPDCLDSPPLVLLLPLLTSEPATRIPKRKKNFLPLPAASVPNTGTEVHRQT